MDEFFAYVAKEQPDLKFNEKEYHMSEKSFELFIKSLIAQDTWGTTEFYKVYNSRNAILNAALETLKKGKFEKYGLN